MEVFLRALMPRLLPQSKSFEVHQFQGKSDLIGKLEDRLRGYSRWLPEDWRIVVIVDRDNDECKDLRRRLDETARRAGLRTPARQGNSLPWQLVNRIAIEELEAWYFGDWVAVREAYPRVPASVPQKQGFRDPDAITGGTWEAFERIMQKHGYFEGGLTKMEAARSIGARIDPFRCSSRSFAKLRDAVVEAFA